MESVAAHLENIENILLLILIVLIAMGAVLYFKYDYQIQKDKIQAMANNFERENKTQPNHE